VEVLGTRLAAFLVEAALAEARFFLAVTERVLDVFFVEDEEPVDLALTDFVKAFGLVVVDGLFLDLVDFALDGIQPPFWKMNHDRHE